MNTWRKPGLIWKASFYQVSSLFLEHGHENKWSKMKKHSLYLLFETLLSCSNHSTDCGTNPHFQKLCSELLQCKKCHYGALWLQFLLVTVNWAVSCSMQPAKYYIALLLMRLGKRMVFKILFCWFFFPFLFQIFFFFLDAGRGPEWWWMQGSWGEELLNFSIDVKSLSLNMGNQKGQLKSAGGAPWAEWQGHCTQRTRQDHCILHPVTSQDVLYSLYCNSYWRISVRYQGTFSTLHHIWHLLAVALLWMSIGGSSFTANREDRVFFLVFGTPQKKMHDIRVTEVMENKAESKEVYWH